MPTDPTPPEKACLRREFAQEVVLRLRDAGFQSLWAGGCVRDLLLTLPPADYDVATDATPQVVLRLFRRTVPVGISFGVVRALAPTPGVEIEVATFRSDGRYLDGRRPETVRFGTAEEDALRRDFTINGMFFDPIRGQILDFVGGRLDLERGILRAIGNPADRFAEDKLRLLRAVRFAARLGFTIEPETDSALLRMADQVSAVAVERIAQELRRILTHPTRAEGMALALRVGILPHILPGLHPTSESLDALKYLPDHPDFELALATLIAAAEQGPPRSLAVQIASHLKLSNHERDRVVWLVDHRHALNDFSTCRPSARKRLLAHPGAPQLLALFRALHTPGPPGLDVVETAFDYLQTLPEGPLDLPPLLDGNDLLARGVPRGPSLGRTLDALHTAQLDGAIHTRSQALDWLEDHGPGTTHP